MRRFAVLLLCFAVAGCAAYDEFYGLFTKKTSPDLEALEASVLTLAQRERTRAGLSPVLAVNPDLCAAAREHSDDMAARNYFDHKSPDGANALNRVQRYLPAFRGALGENIAARGITPENGDDEGALARLIVDAWLKSPPHRATLLSPMFRETGIGIALRNGEIYVTQLFSGPVPEMAEGAPRNSAD